jgi:hypothetical protein
MRAAKHLYSAFLLALALALGQYAGLLHGLGHASEQLSQKPGTPAKVACDQCFACAQLSGGAPSMPAVHEPPAAHEAHAILRHVAASLAATVVFHSRAPPVLS